VLALTLEQARTIGLGVIAVLIVGAVVSVWLVKQVVQKLFLVIVLAVLAVVVWSQRSSLEDCADQVQEEGTAATCSFFGRDVSIN
jgi:uncharacterized membrane protein YfcA